MAICSGQNPEELVFDTTKMRGHLLRCLENKRMEPFSALSRQRRQPTCKTSEQVKVFCKCRLQEDGDMIFCEACGERYHSTCEDIPKAAREPNFKWLCSVCSK